MHRAKVTSQVDLGLRSEGLLDAFLLPACVTIDMVIDLLVYLKDPRPICAFRIVLDVVLDASV